MVVGDNRICLLLRSEMFVVLNIFSLVISYSWLGVNGPISMQIFRVPFDEFSRVCIHHVEEIQQCRTLQLSPNVCFCPSLYTRTSSVQGWIRNLARASLREVNFRASRAPFKMFLLFDCLSSSFKYWLSTVPIVKLLFSQRQTFISLPD